MARTPIESEPRKSPVLFPNEASVLRLVTSILMETSEEWETGRACLSLTQID